jgi:hypothetical protein
VATLLQNEKLPSDCHAVIWNFSPYLTTEEWLEEVKNSAEQADRLFDNGYVDSQGTGQNPPLRVTPKPATSGGVRGW